MSRKTLALLAVVVFIIACKPTETTPTETDTVTTLATVDTTPTIAPPPPPPDYKLDHFKFWRTRQSPFSETLSLWGQADQGWWEATIGPAEWIGNPVRKKHHDQWTVPQYPLHYVTYRLQTKPQPPRKVVLSNQLTNNEKQTWYITNPMWLLTPAGKRLEGEPQPQKGDHFVCYKVEPPKPFQVAIELQDQFDVHFKKSERIAELTPDYFCMPVRKQRKDKPAEGVINAETHLALYAFKPDPLTQPLTANTIDQFRKHKLSVVQSVWLGVPSTKHGKPEVTTEPPN